MNVSFRTSVPANGEATPLVGTLAEFLPFDGQVSIALNQQTGAVGDVLATIQSGSDTLSDEGPIAVQARFPIADDFIFSDVAAAGERLKIKLRNVTAGAIVVVGVVKADPIVG